MSKYHSLKHFIYENQKQPCSIRNCSNKKVGKSNYCSRHRARNYLWRHPEAGFVKTFLYSDELESVTKLINQNDNHEAIIHGRKWLDNMMSAGARCADIRGALFWANLSNQKVSSSELLIRLAGLWLFDKNDFNNRHIKNHHHLIALTGNAVVRFAKMNGIYVPPKIYHQVGDQVKRGIGPLLVNICRSIEKAELTRRKNLYIMGQELNVDGF
jgi:hypothetical protein